MMMGLLTHDHKVPTVEPSQSMDQRDISNTVENTGALSFAYQQLVICHRVQFWGAFAKLQKRLLKCLQLSGKLLEKCQQYATYSQSIQNISD
jgi:hypothetical protein